MNRLNFSDSRGDEYTFMRYSSNAVLVSKKNKNNDLFQKMTFSDQAIEKLKTFLESLTQKIEED